MAPHREERLAQAVRAYDRDRYQDARRILQALAREAPAAPAVRELHGLALYRLGRWNEAIKELRAFHTMSGSFDQHPVLADSYRALGHHGAVDELWRELREASPSAEVVSEGRLVAAGSLADRGDFSGAVRLLEQGARASRRVHPHQVRLWYALADLYERSGDVPKARDLFGRVLQHDPDLFDVAQRAAALA
jgi:tetratricopeptide (TPR) repeat protein